jgi:CubicO group peptidase (beta-lactamase class C family)
MFKSLVLGLLIAAAFPAPARAAAAPGSGGAAVPWTTAAPETAGYSSARLDALGAFLKAGPTAGMLVVVHNKVIFSFGDISKPLKIASIRKSILTILYGRHVIDGEIDTARTVAEAGLQEKSPFLSRERQATIEQLLTSRSGIYLDPRDDPLGAQAPNRNTEFPGTFFYYGNWQYDAAGTAFEKLTGKSIYDSLEAELAGPLGMQDFRRSIQVKIPTPGSVHPEFAMYLSPRDLARIGLMMLQLGRWNGRQIVPEPWVRYMTSVVTPWDEMNPAMLRLRGNPDRWGFGAGWWVWDAQVFPGNLSESPFQGAYEARGAGGQYLTILPARDMLLVHAVDLAAHADPDSQLDQSEWEAIVGLVLASRCHRACAPAAAP